MLAFLDCNNFLGNAALSYCGDRRDLRPSCGLVDFSLKTVLNLVCGQQRLGERLVHVEVIPGFSGSPACALVAASP